MNTTSLLELIERFKTLTPELIHQRLPRLQEKRMNASSTLKSKTNSKDRDSWSLANQFIAENIRLGVAPNWSLICKLNEIIINSESTIRTQNIYLGHQMAVPIENLAAEIARFVDISLNKSPEEPTLNWISRCRYELITIHPFINGNGRTAVLLSDWLLGLQGYLPLSFESKVDNFIGKFSDNRRNATLENADIKLLKCLELSYKVLLGEEI